jgi:hypothetical protein
VGRRESGKLEIKDTFAEFWRETLNTGSYPKYSENYIGRLPFRNPKFRSFGIGGTSSSGGGEREGGPRTGLDELLPERE